MDPHPIPCELFQVTGVGFKQPLKGEDKSNPAAAAERKQKQIEALAQRATYEFRRGQFERARMLGKYLHDVERSPEGTKILSMAPVGNYALSFTFSDAHRTGIFNWSHLRQLSSAPG